MEPCKNTTVADRARARVYDAWGVAPLRIPSQQPVDVTREWLTHTHAAGFTIAPKADGWLAYVVIYKCSSRWIFALVDRAGNVWNLPVVRLNVSAGTGLIFIAEVVGKRVLVFDICQAAGANLSGIGFEDRYDLISEEIDNMELAPGFAIEMKPLWLDSTPSECFEKCRRLPFPCDGLIFTLGSLALSPGVTAACLTKWKPRELLSIDLLMSSGTPSFQSPAGHVPITELCDVMESSVALREGEIGEFVFVFDTGDQTSPRPRVRCHRVRRDKRTANFETTIKHVIAQARDPIGVADLDRWWRCVM